MRLTNKELVIYHKAKGGRVPNVTKLRKLGLSEM